MSRYWIICLLAAIMLPTIGSATKADDKAEALKSICPERICAVGIIQDDLKFRILRATNGLGPGTVIAVYEISPQAAMAPKPPEAFFTAQGRVVAVSAVYDQSGSLWGAKVLEVAGPFLSAVLQSATNK
jgi:hypothetical protein